MGEDGGRRYGMAWHGLDRQESTYNTKQRRYGISHNILT